MKLQVGFRDSHVSFKEEGQISINRGCPLLIWTHNHISKIRKQGGQSKTKKKVRERATKAVYEGNKITKGKR